MPCIPCGDKYKLGEKGKCMYSTKAACEKAYKGYLFKKYNKGGRRDGKANK